MRVAVCFFGLTRSLKYTITSIQDNIYNQLNKNGIAYDVYLHSYDLKVLTCSRSKEYECILDPEEYKLLEPTKAIIDSQEKFDSTFVYPSVFKYGDIWKTNFENVRNLIRQLNSLKQVTKMWSEEDIKYDCYLYIRPDLVYNDPINIELLKKVSKSRKPIYVSPNWLKCKGLNDRFGFGNRSAMLTIGNRIDAIQEFCNSNPLKPVALHSEQLLLFVCKKYGIRLLLMPLRASRVRANGKINEEKFYRN